MKWGEVARVKGKGRQRGFGLKKKEQGSMTCPKIKRGRETHLPQFFNAGTR